MPVSILQPGDAPPDTTGEGPPSRGDDLRAAVAYALAAAEQRTPVERNPTTATVAQPEFRTPVERNPTTATVAAAAPAAAPRPSGPVAAAPASSGYVENYIAQSIQPLLGLRGTYNSQESALLASLMEKYGLSRDQLSQSRTLGRSEIADAADETAAVLAELAESQGVRQADLAGRASAATDRVNQSRTERQDQLLAAIGAAGGDVSQIGGDILQSDSAVSREQAAGSAALAATQALGQNQLGRAGASGGLIEQSSLSQLANNYRAASASLNAAELDARTEIESSFAQQRAELEFNIAQATVQARREAEAELQRRKEAAARAAAKSQGEKGLSLAGAQVIAEQLGVPIEQVLAYSEAGAGSLNAFVARFSDATLDAVGEGRDAEQAAGVAAGLATLGLSDDQFADLNLSPEQQLQYYTTVGDIAAEEEAAAAAVAKIIADNPMPSSRSVGLGGISASSNARHEFIQDWRRRNPGGTIGEAGAAATAAGVVY